jgi:DNA mismatch repair protein MutS
MEQYIEIKAANPDCLLFYRMGDFYELFFEDAEIAARALGIVLTKRGKHLGRDIPMCGVPVHPFRRISAPPDRARPSRRGLRAARGSGRGEKRGGKSVVRRDVIRLVTPGTLTEDTLLDARRNNYLLAIARARASAEREPLRARLDRHLDRRIPHRRMRPRRLAAEIARLEPARSSCRTRSIATPSLRPICARCRR